MNDSSEIRWLHISDLHIGSQANPWLDSTLRNRLNNFLSRYSKFDFIIISGDVIHQGKYKDNDNVNAAKELFSELREFSDHLILCLGNHDYARDEGRYMLLQKWQRLEDDEKIKNELSYRNKLKGDSSDFIGVCEEYLEVENADKLSSSYICDSVQGINIIVLNTCIFCGQPVLSETGDIVKENDQVVVNDFEKIRLTAKDLPNTNKINNDYPTIIIGHHPYSMMDSISKIRLTDMMANIPARFYFCGHSHKKGITTVGNDMKQYTSAGLFKDEYNNPTIGLHWLKKSQNTKISNDFYIFKNEDWERLLDSGSDETSVPDKSYPFCESSQSECIEGVLQYFCSINKEALGLKSDIEAVVVIWTDKRIKRRTFYSCNKPKGSRRHRVRDYSFGVVGMLQDVIANPDDNETRADCILFYDHEKYATKCEYIMDFRTSQTEIKDVEEQTWKNKKTKAMLAISLFRQNGDEPQMFGALTFDFAESLIDKSPEQRTLLFDSVRQCRDILVPLLVTNIKTDYKAQFQSLVKDEMEYLAKKKDKAVK